MSTGCRFCQFMFLLVFRNRTSRRMTNIGQYMLSILVRMVSLMVLMRVWVLQSITALYCFVINLYAYHCWYLYSEIFLPLLEKFSVLTPKSFSLTQKSFSLALKLFPLLKNYFFPYSKIFFSYSKIISPANKIISPSQNCFPLTRKLFPLLGN